MNIAAKNHDFYESQNRHRELEDTAQNDCKFRSLDQQEKVLHLCNKNRTLGVKEQLGGNNSWFKKD